MKLTASIGRQAGDFLTYILLPLACGLLPYSWGQRLVRQVAQQGWLLRARSVAALQIAQHHLAVPDAAQWQSRWRLVELMEARDLWLSLLGRHRVLIRAVRQEGLPAPTDRLVLLGLHWGPSALALALFRDAGLQPRFVYRPVPGELLRAAPFHYLYLRLLVAYIRRMCAGRDITVPGARKALVAALAEPGAPVILLDAPLTHGGRSAWGRVLDLETEFYREGPELLVERQARCVLYTLGLDQDGVNVLTCSEVFEPASAEQVLEQFAALMSRCLATDSAQWRLWHAADQLFRGRRPDRPSPTGH